jgi:hypothetical protein
MNEPTAPDCLAEKSDSELGQMLRTRAEASGCSPEHFLSLAETLACWQRHAHIPARGPLPTNVLVEEITDEHVDSWPEWSKRLVGPGSRIEQLTWPGGTVSTRLLTRRGLVLASVEESGTAG